MALRSFNITALKGKIPREAEQAIVDIHAKIDTLSGTMTALKQQVATLPTAAQLQQHAAKIQQAISTLPAFDATVAGVSSAHIPQGSILPIVSGAFAYTSNANSITWYWDGTNGSSILTLKWPDKSITQVPASSASVTGLAGSTAYSFFTYFDTVLGAVIFSADPVAGSGSPPIAFGPGASILVATAIQSQDNHAPLNLSTMQGATTAGGAGGGSSGGRFGGCVSEDTELLALGGDLYSYLVPAELWVEIRSLSGRKLRAVPEHRIFTEDGCVSMGRLRPGMSAVTIDGLEHIKSAEIVREKGRKRVVWVPKGNLYWSAGILSHNIK